MALSLSTQCSIAKRFVNFILDQDVATSISVTSLVNLVLYSLAVTLHSCEPGVKVHSNILLEVFKNMLLDHSMQ